jgi:hypothetical protein
MDLTLEPSRGRAWDGSHAVADADPRVRIEIVLATAVGRQIFGTELDHADAERVVGKWTHRATSFELAASEALGERLRRRRALRLRSGARSEQEAHERADALRISRGFHGDHAFLALRPSRLTAHLCAREVTFEQWKREVSVKKS